MSKRLYINNIKTLSLLAVICLLSACSSAPVTLKHYLLDQQLNAYQGQTYNGETLVTLQRIKLARYLQQSQLAMLQQDNQLYFASQHVWAEELNHGISRALRNDINQQQDMYIFAANEPGQKQSQYQLQIQIDHLVATDQSKVMLAGKFWLMQQQELKASTPFYFEASLSQDGFDHAVSQQRKLLSQLAEKITQVIQQQ